MRLLAYALGLPLSLAACGSEPAPLPPTSPSPFYGNAVPNDTGSDDDATSDDDDDDDDKAKKAKDKKKKPVEDEPDADGGNVRDPEPPPPLAPAPAPAPAPSPDGGSLPDPEAPDGGATGDEVDDEPSGEIARAKLMEACGVDTERPELEILSANAAGAPQQQSGEIKSGLFTVDYMLIVTPTVALRSTTAASVSSLSFAVSGNNERAITRAETATDLAAGSSSAELVRIDERLEPGKAVPVAAPAAGWEKIVCTVAGARKLTTQTGAGSVDVTFDPPLPTGIFAGAAKERFDAELATDKTWSGVKATIVTSTVSGLTAGTVLTGTVSLRRIGAVSGFTGDLAYELAIDFGGAQVTNSLGLRPSTKFFVDSRLRRLTGMLVDTQLPLAMNVPGVPQTWTFIVP